MEVSSGWNVRDSDEWFDVGINPEPEVKKDSEVVIVTEGLIKLSGKVDREMERIQKEIANIQQYQYSLSANVKEPEVRGNSMTLFDNEVIIDDNSALDKRLELSNRTAIEIIPHEYSEKRFLYVSSYIVDAMIGLKNFARWATSFIIPGDSNIESTSLILEEAHRERQLKNIIRCQKAIDMSTRKVASAIRKNKDQVSFAIGKISDENKVAAIVVIRHLMRTPYCGRVTEFQDGINIYLDVSIKYN